MSMGGESDRVGRRAFLGQAAAFGATAFAHPSPGRRVQWLRSLASVAQPAEPFQFDETSVVQLQAEMAAGRLTARAVTEHYLQRIAELDLKGPNLHSIIETNPEAMQLAEELDRERTQKGSRGCCTASR